ncbi:MAG: hypothetical protein IJU52_03090, partial [Clostridia bacterium]|nr:hypothetical protein [Clostridia bacterium]
MKVFGLIRRQAPPSPIGEGSSATLSERVAPKGRAPRLRAPRAIVPVKQLFVAHFVGVADTFAHENASASSVGKRHLSLGTPKRRLLLR